MSMNKQGKESVQMDNNRKLKLDIDSHELIEQNEKFMNFRNANKQKSLDLFTQKKMD